MYLYTDVMFLNSMLHIMDVLNFNSFSSGTVGGGGEGGFCGGGRRGDLFMLETLPCSGMLQLVSVVCGLPAPKNKKWPSGCTFNSQISKIYL